MFDYIKKNQLRISLAIALVSFFFILVSQTRKSRIDNEITATVQNVSSVFVNVVHFFSSGIGGFWDKYIWLINVSDENKQLLAEIDRLEEENAKYYEWSLTHQRLLEALDFQKKNPDKKIFAEVIGEAGEGYSKVLILNKGYSHGIKKNFAVVTPKGIVGKILTSNKYHSMVQLIIDPRSQFPVLNQSTRRKMILQGSPEEKLYITLAQRRMPLAVGDRIISSGLAGILPKGLLIGEVEEIQKKNFGLFQQAVLKPAVDFSRIEEVFVILETQRNINSPLFTEPPQQ